LRDDDSSNSAEIILKFTSKIKEDKADNKNDVEYHFANPQPQNLEELKKIKKDIHMDYILKESGLVEHSQVYGENK
jgi:hypothetical protein